MNPAPPVTTARTSRIVGDAMFVTFEGIDGSGKSDPGARSSRDWLARRGRDVVYTREPGGTRARRGDARAAPRTAAT